jgi:copper ion binding protein
MNCHEEKKIKNREERMVKKRLRVLGMSCQHCVNRVAKIIGGFDGISNVDVVLEKEEANFNCDLDKTNVQSIIQAIVDAGYQASEI